MNYITSILIVFLSVFFHPCVLSQIHFRNLQIKEGLSLVNDIYRDHRGFLWIGNDGLGLIKTDGVNAKVYNFNKNDKNSISNNGITCLLEDSSQSLWIGTRSDLNKYVPAQDNFKRYHKTGVINSIYNDKFNRLWICSSNGLYLYDSKKDSFIIYSINKVENKRNSITGISQDSENEYWVTNSYNGIYNFTPQSGTFKHYKNSKTIDSVGSNKKILIDKSGIIWIGSERNGLIEFNKRTKTFSHYPSSGNKIGTQGVKVKDIFEENDSTLFIAIDQGGINVLNKKTKKFTYINSTNVWDNGLLSNGIYCFHKDYKDILWVGTSRGGIYSYNPKQESFKVYKKINSKASDSNISLNYKVVSFIFNYDKKNQIWVGTDGGGLNIVERSTGEIKTLKHNSFDNNSVSSNVIRSITSDTSGTIWVACWGAKELNKYNASKQNFDHVFFEKQKKAFNSSDIWHFKIDRFNRYWVTFENGYILLMDQKGNKIADLSPENPRKSKSSPFVFSDTEGNYYVNSFEAIFKYKEDSKHFEKFINIPNALSFNQDNNGDFWIGTSNEGIFKCNKKNAILNNYTEKDGLPDNSALSILKSFNGDMWIATYNGISQFIWSKQKFINHDKLDGISGNQFYYQSYSQTPEGELLFGGIEGITSFTPKEIDYDSTALPCYFTDLFILGEKVDYRKENPYLKNHLNYTNEIIMDHDVSFFSIGFTTPNFTFPRKIRYAYKLKGFDDNWIISDFNNRKATYTRLAPGKYTFCVAATQPYIDSIAKHREITIIILPPWWQTWWFRMLFIAFLFTVLLSFYFYRINQLKKNQEILKQTVKEKTNDLNEANQELMAQKEEIEATLEALKETQTQLVRSEKMASVGILAGGISHEINNPLNFIQGGNAAIDIYVNESLENKHKKVLLPLIDIVNKGVERASEIVKSLNRFHKKSINYDENCNIHSIIDECLFMLNQQMQEIKIEKEYTSKKFSLTGNEGDLHQVFLNILTNSIHAIECSGLITIKTSIINRILNIEIKDTGKGIAPENLSKVTSPFFTTKAPGNGVGLGMSIAYSIIRQHNGHIHYTSKVGEGTTVLVCLPIIKNHQVN